MTAQNFAAYTRSTAFSMSLSAKMIDRLLGLWTITDLADRYEWWQPPPTCATAGPWDVSATDRGLQRRGLLEINEDHTQLTRPGWLVAELLIEAEFPRPTKAHQLLGFAGAVPPHPDDCDDLGGRRMGAIMLNHQSQGSGGVAEFVKYELPRDRRLDLWKPGDELFWCDFTDHQELRDLKRSAGIPVGADE